MTPTREGGREREREIETNRGGGRDETSPHNFRPRIEDRKPKCTVGPSKKTAVTPTRKVTLTCHRERHKEAIASTLSMPSLVYHMLYRTNLLVVLVALAGNSSWHKPQVECVPLLSSRTSNVPDTRHAGICATPPGMDSTGVPITACQCATAKHFEGDFSAAGIATGVAIWGQQGFQAILRHKEPLDLRNVLIV